MIAYSCSLHSARKRYVISAPLLVKTSVIAAALIPEAREVLSMIIPL